MEKRLENDVLSVCCARIAYKLHIQVSANINAAHTHTHAAYDVHKYISVTIMRWSQ